MSGFRIGWGDRIGVLLTGRVRLVTADTPPVVVMRTNGGAACSIDDDAFGFYARPFDPRRYEWDRPVLAIDEPRGPPRMACPCCGSVVTIDHIQKPHRSRIALWRQLRRSAGRAA